MTRDSSHLNNWDHISNTSFGFSIGHVIGESEELFVCLVAIRFDDERQAFNRSLVFRDPFASYWNDLSFSDVYIPIRTDSYKLEDVNPTLDMVGAFISDNNETVVISRYDTGLQYCTLEEVIIGFN